MGDTNKPAKTEMNWLTLARDICHGEPANMPEVEAKLDALDLLVKEFDATTGVPDHTEDTE